MTSNDLKGNSNASIKNNRDDIKGGNPSDNQNYGRDPIEQAFSSN